MRPFRGVLQRSFGLAGIPDLDYRPAGIPPAVPPRRHLAHGDRERPPPGRRSPAAGRSPTTTRWRARSSCGSRTPSTASASPWARSSRSGTTATSSTWACRACRRTSLHDAPRVAACLRPRRPARRGVRAARLARLPGRPEPPADRLEARRFGGCRRSACSGATAGRSPRWSSTACARRARTSASSSWPGTSGKPLVGGGDSHLLMPSGALCASRATTYAGLHRRGPVGLEHGPSSRASTSRPLRWKMTLRVLSFIAQYRQIAEFRGKPICAMLDGRRVLLDPVSTLAASALRLSNRLGCSA